MNTTNYTTTAGNTYEIFHDYAYSTNIKSELDFDTLQEVKDYCEAYDKAQAYGATLAQLGAVAFDCAGNNIDLLDRLPEVKYIYIPNKAAIAIFQEWTGALVDTYRLGHATDCKYFGNSALLSYCANSDSYKEVDAEISVVIYTLLNK